MLCDIKADVALRLTAMLPRADLASMNPTVPAVGFRGQVGGQPSSFTAMALLVGAAKGLNVGVGNGEVISASQWN